MAVHGHPCYCPLCGGESGDVALRGHSYESSCLQPGDVSRRANMSQFEWKCSTVQKTLNFIHLMVVIKVCQFDTPIIQMELNGLAHSQSSINTQRIFLCNVFPFSQDVFI